MAPQPMTAPVSDRLYDAPGSGVLVCSVQHLCERTRRRIADYDPRLWTAISLEGGYAFPVTALDDLDLCAAAPDLCYLLGHARQRGFYYILFAENGRLVRDFPVYPA